MATLDLSPDGKSLAVERAGQLIVMDAGTGRVLTKLGPGLLPRWSPDGHQLAFYSRRSGKLQLWTWTVAAAAPQQLTDLPDGVDPDIATRIMGYISDAFHFSWSPDSTHIVFSSRVPVASAAPGRRGAPLVLDETTPSDLTLFDVFAHPGGGTGGVVEAPDGRDLGFRPAHDGETLHSQLFVVDLTRHQTIQLTHDQAEAFDPAWSPSGRAIAFARIDSSVSGAAGSVLTATTGKIMLLDDTTRQMRVLSQGDGIRYRPLWSSDGSRLSYLVSKSFDGAASIQVIAPDSGKSVETYILGGPVVAYDWDHASTGDNFIVSYVSGGAADVAHVRDASFLTAFSTGEPEVWSQSDGGRLAWITGESLRDVWVSGGDRQSANRIADLAPTNALDLGRELTVTWTNARHEGLSGSLLLPPNYKPGKRYPLIVDVYPLAGSTGWMNPLSGNQAWASAGYAVFKPRPRAPQAAPNCSGPPSYCAAGQGVAGLDTMVDDVMGGVAEIDRRGFIDTKRMCLYGHSSGGGVVDYLVTRTNAFKCAVSIAPVLPNWLGTSFLWYDSLIFMSPLAGAKPWEDPSSYVKLSAVLHADMVKTPMLLADGDEDGSFLLGTIEMYNALRATGVKVTLLRYPDQGHVLTGAALKDFWLREMRFFSEHLAP
jgi:acylaminoacyl-peptidase